MEKRANNSSLMQQCSHFNAQENCLETSLKCKLQWPRDIQLIRSGKGSEVCILNKQLQVILSLVIFGPAFERQYLLNNWVVGILGSSPCILDYRNQDVSCYGQERTWDSFPSALPWVLSCLWLRNASKAHWCGRGLGGWYFLAPHCK